VKITVKSKNKISPATHKQGDPAIGEVCTEINTYTNGRFERISMCFYTKNTTLEDKLIETLRKYCNPLH